MTSKERIKAALERRPADRLPKTRFRAPIRVPMPSKDSLNLRNVKVPDNPPKAGLIFSFRRG